MKQKLKEIFTNWRVILLLAMILLACVAIYPNFGAEGVAIRNVLTNSSSANAGIENPKSTATPMSREVIKYINNIPIINEEGYNEVKNTFSQNEVITIETNKGLYKLTLGEDPELGMSIYNAPTSNLRKGLDLQGGTRVLLQPAESISSNDMGLLLESLKQRLNVYGLADIIVREASDLSGNQYVLVEIAGANEQEVKDLLAKQGKFEAKIGNETVFKGGGNDITYVCRSADCSGIDPRSPCQGDIGNFACRFSFEIALSPDAAEVQASLTEKLEVVSEEGSPEGYLSESLALYLDDKKVDELKIAADLKGRAVTEISISGSGTGTTQEAAITDTLKNMKRLQTIIITGSLPVKLDIVQTNNISPFLGKEFLNNAILVGLLSILAVSTVISIRYRQIKIALPVLFICISEVIMLLGFAALVGWNLDLAAIAGILVAVGTGVDDQIVIVDETVMGAGRTLNWKVRFKRAFFIIFSAYATTMFAMGPLLFAGAGIVKGFALTTMAGITFGVLIARPAFAEIIRILVKE